MKRVRYVSRKARADVRRRVKGRFVKAGDAYDYDPLSHTRSCWEYTSFKLYLKKGKKTTQILVENYQLNFPRQGNQFDTTCTFLMQWQSCMIQLLEGLFSHHLSMGGDCASISVWYSATKDSGRSWGTHLSSSFAVSNQSKWVLALLPYFWWVFRVWPNSSGKKGYCSLSDHMIILSTCRWIIAPSYVMLYSRSLYVCVFRVLRSVLRRPGKV